jgi:hypothetical protein
MRRLPPNWAHILANVDYDRRMAFVALGPGHELIGVARYVYDERAREAEIAISYRGPIGKEAEALLLGELIGYAQEKGLATPPGVRSSPRTCECSKLSGSGKKAIDPRSNAELRVLSCLAPREPREPSASVQGTSSFPHLAR